MGSCVPLGTHVTPLVLFLRYLPDILPANLGEPFGGRPGPCYAFGLNGVITSRGEITMLDTGETKRLRVHGVAEASAFTARQRQPFFHGRSVLRDRPELVGQPSHNMARSRAGCDEQRFRCGATVTVLRVGGGSKTTSSPRTQHDPSGLCMDLAASTMPSDHALRGLFRHLRDAASFGALALV